MNNKEGNKQTKQIHLEKKLINVKQLELIHKTLRASQKITCHIRH
jgi:hypothetical protein